MKFQTLNNRQHKTVITEKPETDESYNYPSLLGGESFQDAV